jgi:hypothetical protein
MQRTAGVLGLIAGILLIIHEEGLCAGILHGAGGLVVHIKPQFERPKAL